MHRSIIVEWFGLVENFMNVLPTSLSGPAARHPTLGAPSPKLRMICSLNQFSPRDCSSVGFYYRDMMTNVINARSEMFCVFGPKMSFLCSQFKFANVFALCVSISRAFLASMADK